MAETLSQSPQQRDNISIFVKEELRFTQIKISPQLEGRNNSECEKLFDSQKICKNNWLSTQTCAFNLGFEKAETREPLEFAD